MRLRPSIHGFYMENYLFATVLSLLMFFSSFYLMSAGEFLISLGLVLLGILIIIVGVIHSIVNSRSCVLYIQNDQQLVYETGILSHNKKIAPISRITDSTLKRSFFERILGIADLQINTSGTGGIEIEADDFNYVELSKINDRINYLIHQTPAEEAAEQEQQKKE